MESQNAAITVNSRSVPVQGPNDYASMEEVLTQSVFPWNAGEQGTCRKKERILSYGSFTRFPDLIMMDGGRGQVNIALAVLEQSGAFYSCMRYGKG